MNNQNQEPMTRPEFETLKQGFDQLQGDLRLVKDALLGNEYNNKKGIVNTLNDHEKRLEEIEQGRLKEKWLLIGLSAGSGMGVFGLIKTIIETLHGIHV